MNNQIKEIYDINSIEKDINDRNEIINEYTNTRHLDRDEAISKIMELREKMQRLQLLPI